MMRRRPAIDAPDAPNSPAAPLADPARRAAIGHAVARRLADNPETSHIDAPGMQMFCVPAFLTGEECAALCSLIDADAIASSLYEGDEAAGYRTSSSCNLNPANPLVDVVQLAIADLLGQPVECSETVQGQRYHIGQQYKAHHDFFHEPTSYYAAEIARGGQRTWTAMVYLNEPQAGGATDFPHAGISIHPQTGLLLAWNNMQPDGTPNPRTLHSAKPVEQGSKYVLTKWFRESRWGEP